jgi:flavin-dependent dehydrogenase
MKHTLPTECDVAIIGGGPAGATVATLLRKYNSSLKVVVLEREGFPRDHVGESMLPAICPILHEMGVWDKVEAANFPIKVGATYRWGSTQDLWHFEFLVGRLFVDEARPAKFEGQRRETAFQVDRAVYDKILLDHARDVGVDVYERTRVEDVLVEGDRVVGLKIAPTDTSGEATLLVARYYIDGSGASALLRRKIGVEIQSPTNLRNIAVWDYWQDARWAVNIGTGGTRIQIMSLSWGWLWFIPVSESRTSVGLIMPAQTYKERGKSPEELYLEAVKSEPRISELLANAHREEKLSTTNDWSYVANRLAGENWFLVGDACGFADPILSAGMTLAHTGARRVAYTILDLERGIHEAQWLRDEYDRQHRSQIGHHIRFADFWYSSNGCFTDLKDNCSAIAKHAGLSLNPEEAFRWLSTGGFATEDYSNARAGTYRLAAIKNFTEILTDDEFAWSISKKNEFRLNLAGAKQTEVSVLKDGEIQSVPCYRRGANLLPMHGMYRAVFTALNRERDATRIAQMIMHALVGSENSQLQSAMTSAYEILEAMIIEGWITAKYNKNRPLLNVTPPKNDATLDRYAKI